MFTKSSPDPTIISVVSGKGGVGKTMLSVAVARELSLHGPTLVLDLDFFNRGLSGLMTQARPKFPVSPPEFLEHLATPDWRVSEIATNLYTVSFPDISGAELPTTDESSILVLQAQLRNWIFDLSAQLQCSIVILDCHGGPDPLSFAAVGISQKTLLISEPDRVTMFGTLHFLRSLSALSMDTKNIHLVFNKVVNPFRPRFLKVTYNQHLREYFDNKPLLASFPLEVYLIKHFEHQPFVTDDFPRSMLARKVQVMLADVLEDANIELVPEGTRKLPRLIAHLWRNSFGRRPRILDLDFAMMLCFVVLVALFSAMYLEKCHLLPRVGDSKLSALLFPILAVVPVWALFLTLLSWSKRLNERITFLSRRNLWAPFSLYSFILLLIWVLPIALVVALMLENWVTDPELRFFPYLWYLILCVVFVVWLSHVFDAFRDLRYTRYRAEPSVKVLVGSIILISGGLLIDGVPFRDSVERFFRVEPFSFERLNRSDLSSARKLEVDGHSVEVSNKGELDWFTFSVTRSGVHVISVDSVNGDPTMALYGPHEVNFLTEDDDGGGGYDSLITRELSAGIYFLAVREFTEDNFSYSTRVFRLEMDAFEDLRESDARSPRPLQIDAGIAGVDNQGGLDWFTFSVTSTGAYVLSVISDDGDSTMALYGPDEFVFMAEDDDGGEGVDSRIRKDLRPGRYLLAVREYDGQGFSYSLKVSPINMLQIDGESRNEDSDGISDWFMFSVQGTQGYVVSVRSEAGDPVMAIYDASTGSIVAEDDDGGDGTNAELRMEFLPGDYLVNVRDYSVEPLQYSISISRNDL